MKIAKEKLTCCIANRVFEKNFSRKQKWTLKKFCNNVVYSSARSFNVVEVKVFNQFYNAVWFTRSSIFKNVLLDILINSTIEFLFATFNPTGAPATEPVIFLWHLFIYLPSTISPPTNVNFTSHFYVKSIDAFLWKTF